MKFFYLILIIVISERAMEFYIARKNEEWMKQRGGIEVGEKHYPLFIIVQACFFFSFILEVHSIERIFIPSLFFLFLILLLGRIWCIIALGRFWNTKVIVVPNVIRMKRGPYRLFRHPNYAILILETLTLPLMFGAIKTAILFTCLQFALLFVRIPCEERALRGQVE